MMLGPRSKWRTSLHREQQSDYDAIDLELVEETISYIVTNCPPGAILVFLTGWDDIKSLDV
jgi:hypothetical protein